MEDIHNVRFPLKGLFSYAFEARTQFDESVLNQPSPSIVGWWWSLHRGWQISFLCSRKLGTYTQNVPRFQALLHTIRKVFQF